MENIVSIDMPVNESIPAELRALPQWVVADANKRPYDPKTGRAADVTDPSTWGTYEDAEAARVRMGHPHIGFVLTEKDPYTIIDLDKTTGTPEDEERAKGIFDYFDDTYAELSQSGDGVHIVGKGKLPKSTYRRGKVEVYTAKRQMIFTGKVLRDCPITDCQEKLDELVAQMPTGGVASGELVEIKGDRSDDEVLAAGFAAANGEKFTALWEGRWQDTRNRDGQPYPSASEADYALVDMLWFHSKDTESGTATVCAVGNGEAAERRQGTREASATPDRQVRRHDDREDPGQRAASRGRHGATGEAE